MYTYMHTCTCIVKNNIDLIDSSLRASLKSSPQLLLFTLATLGFYQETQGSICSPPSLILVYPLEYAKNYKFRWQTFQRPLVNIYNLVLSLPLGQSMKEMLCIMHVQYTCKCIHTCVYNNIILLRYQCLAVSNCCTCITALPHSCTTCEH